MSLEVFADCKRADIQITNANPFLVNFNIAQTQPVSLTITHAPFTGSRRCVYAVVFNYGRANNFSNRRHSILPKMIFFLVDFLELFPLSSDI